MQAKIIEVIEVTEYETKAHDHGNCGYSELVPVKKYFLADGSPLVLEATATMPLPADPNIYVTSGGKISFVTTN